MTRILFSRRALLITTMLGLGAGLSAPANAGFEWVPPPQEPAPQLPPMMQNAMPPAPVEPVMPAPGMVPFGAPTASMPMQGNPYFAPEQQGQDPTTMPLNPMPGEMPPAPADMSSAESANAMAPAAGGGYPGMGPGAFPQNQQNQQNQHPTQPTPPMGAFQAPYQNYNMAGPNPDQTAGWTGPGAQQMPPHRPNPQGNPAAQIQTRTMGHPNHPMAAPPMQDPFAKEQAMANPFQPHPQPNAHNPQLQPPPSMPANSMQMARPTDLLAPPPATQGMPTPPMQQGNLRSDERAMNPQDMQNIQPAAGQPVYIPRGSGEIRRGDQIPASPYAQNPQISAMNGQMQMQRPTQNAPIRPDQYAQPENMQGMMMPQENPAMHPSGNAPNAHAATHHKAQQGAQAPAQGNDEQNALNALTPAAGPSRDDRIEFQSPPPATTSKPPAIYSSVPQYQRPPAPASRFETVEGFGSDMPLALALRQIVPADYSFAFGTGVNPGQRVSWNGGDRWDIVLDQTLNNASLDADLRGQTIFIYKNFPGAAAPIQPPMQPPGLSPHPSPLAPPPMAGIPMAAPMPGPAPTYIKRGERNPVPAPHMIEPFAGDEAPSNPTQDMARAEGNNTASTPNNMAAASPPKEIDSVLEPLLTEEPPVMQAPTDIAAASANDQKPVALSSFQVANGSPRRNVIRDPGLKDDTGHIPAPTSHPGDQNPQDILSASNHDQRQNLNPYPLSTAPQPIQTWQGQKGESLKTVLKRWSEQNDTQIVWSASRDYELSHDFSIQGRLSGALNALLKSSLYEDEKPDVKLVRSGSGDSERRTLIVQDQGHGAFPVGVSMMNAKS